MSSSFHIPRLLLALSLGLGGAACEFALGEIPPDTLERFDAGASVFDEPDGGRDEPELEDDLAGEDELPSQVPAPRVDASAMEMDPSTPEDPADDPQPNTGDCAHPVAWYADQDGDGFGAGPAHPYCQRPGNAWSKTTGDCADNDPLVFPGQKAFFGAPFVRTNGTDSFDYDCSGKEEGNPSQSLEPRCETMPGPKCGASGYSKSTRTSSGANAYCGSRSVESCKSTITVVLCKSVVETVTAPYACH